MTEHPANSHSETTANKLLDALLATGIDYVFANLGTDHVPIIEALARRRHLGLPSPNFILCPHENIAVHMALGYASYTGKGQAVMVHVDAGTANAAMGIANAARTRLPVLLMAGKAPFDVQGVLSGGRDNYVHFVQDPFDIASLVRPYLKWEYVLMTDANLNEVCRRAHSLMHSEPAGPAFMVMPREVLAAPVSHNEPVFGADRFGAVQQGGLTETMIADIAQRLMNSTDPVVVTSYLGRRLQAPALLQAFCERYGARVVEANPTHLNIDRSSEYAAGFDAGKLIGQADLVLLLDTDVPWLPKFVKPRAGATCIQVDTDASKGDFPMWGFSADLRVQADTLEALRGLIAYGATHGDEHPSEAVQKRKAAWMASQSAPPATQAPPPGPGVALRPVLQLLNNLIDAQDIVVNEAIRNAPFVLQDLTRTQPGTYFSNAGGGLGASSGWSLGLKLANPNRRVIQIVGDGSFHFCTPTSFYSVARDQNLPILTLVLNNGGWQAVKEAVLRMHPEGEAFKAKQFEANLHSHQTRFILLAEAFGAKGLEIESNETARSVLMQALSLLDAGHSVLVDVKLPPVE